MLNKILAALFVVAAIALTIPFVARTENINRPTPSLVARVNPPHVAEGRPIATDEEPQVVSLQVSPSGFQPSETTARPGKFLILVQNRSGQRGLSFYLIRDNQQRLGNSESDKRDWKAQIQLGPGTYIVGEKSHPEWQSILRVTN